MTLPLGTILITENALSENTTSHESMKIGKKTVLVFGEFEAYKVKLGYPVENELPLHPTANVDYVLPLNIGIGLPDGCKNTLARYSSPLDVQVHPVDRNVWDDPDEPME